MAHTGTSVAVEASSLAALTAIADQPPPQPYAPLAPSTPPLVLYIARVPGSRDVFLTPLKPKAKVVSAEDVQSSLYYVHVNTLEDRDRLLDQPAPAPDVHITPTEETAAAAAAAALARKPVSPTRAVASANDTPPYPEADLMPDLNGRLRPIRPAPIPRKPLLRETRNPDPAQLGSLSPAPPPHHDLLPVIPPRPLPLTPPDERKSATERPDAPVSFHGHILQNTDHRLGTHNPYTLICSSPPHTKQQQQQQPLGSLILIRRDPVSSAQWNVARISDPPIPEITNHRPTLNMSGTSARTKKGGAPLYLDIMNPGYSQFGQATEGGQRRAGSGGSGDVLYSEDPSPVRPQDDGEVVFRRRLYLPGSRYAEHGYGTSGPTRSSVEGHRRLKSADDDVRRQERWRPMIRERTNSDSLFSTTDDGGRGGAAKVDRRGKFYSFASPWEGGTCEFATGATGRALKCRHTIVGLGDQGKASRTTPIMRTEEISELRFNLPTSSSSAVSEKRPWSHVRFPSTSLSDDDADGEVDLSLGRERAGGGFGGKRAKLGKLIVWPAGWKMLDLVVAANMGLWWRAYERV